MNGQGRVPVTRPPLDVHGNEAGPALSIVPVAKPVGSTLADRTTGVPASPGTIVAGEHRDQERLRDRSDTWRVDRLADATIVGVMPRRAGATLVSMTGRRNSESAGVARAAVIAAVLIPR